VTQKNKNVTTRTELSHSCDKLFTMVTSSNERKLFWKRQQAAAKTSRNQ